MEEACGLHTAEFVSHPLRTFKPEQDRPDHLSCLCGNTITCHNRVVDQWLCLPNDHELCRVFKTFPLKGAPWCRPHCARRRQAQIGIPNGSFLRAYLLIFNINVYVDTIGVQKILGQDAGCQQFEG